MEVITGIIAGLGGAISPVATSQAAEMSGGSLLAILFLGFGALIILCQFIPGLILFCSMIKGLFTGSLKKSLPIADETMGKNL